MFLDQETLRPVIIAMALYLAINILVPRILKKPTGIKPIDDLVMTMIAQQDTLMNGTILIGLVVLGTNYIQEKFM
ncbi:hypothetical protein AP053_gp200 [Ostreococcus mediterraneus virus 1]|uniref:hypothetical protein n=1 Tax=Ostreococcus mediterraneus virus 1 TaxID=1663210 RepID=UPI0006CF5D20|nr:hypothetical protein AP053_gp200 [Ostreococcus mediterraneus virus 1]ALI95345.1 hypothetical protein OmV1_234 [Ostreococcus mediterraneus virus 1]